MKTNTNSRQAYLTLYILASIAALLYLAWFIGYIVNPQVATRGIASELAVKGQPYAELFLITDTINLVIIGLISVTMIRLKKSAITKRIALFYMLFGVATLLSTRFSLLCAPSVGQCVAEGDVLLRMVTHYSLGVTAGLALFVSAYETSKLLDTGIRRKFKLILFTALCLGVMSVVFSFISLDPVFLSLFQRIYLLTLAAYIVAIPYMVSKHAAID